MKAVYMIVATRHIEGAEALVASLKRGEPMILRRDPVNQYDTRAVEIVCRGTRVGFVPMRDNAKLADRLDKMGPGAEIAGTYAPSGHRWVEVDE
jgi:hypothetical protein